jgi:hypothetical protein
MDDPNDAIGIQTDEEILTYTASDEALEAAGGIGGTDTFFTVDPPCVPPHRCFAHHRQDDDLWLGVEVLAALELGRDINCRVSEGQYPLASEMEQSHG